MIMDKISDSSKKPKPRRTGCFLGCLPFSGKKSSSNYESVANRKKTRWWRFLAKNSASRTVPVDPEKVNRTRELKSVKNPGSSKRHIPSAGVNATKVPAPDQKGLEQAPKTKYEISENIVLDNPEDLDPLDAPNDKDTCQKGLACIRKRLARKSGLSHPGSPVSGQTTTILSQSASFPAPKPKKQSANSDRISRVNPHRGSRKYDRKKEPVIGMSIIMVTLVIMLLWGKLCAILCTSAWFYVVPRLRTAVKSDKTLVDVMISGDLDLNSEEYKKKVVLEGFLERNHRSGVGFL